MKQFLIIILLSALCSSCRKDLLHWDRVQKLETHTATDRLNKIFFINDSVGFVAGGQRFDNSTILRTEDGGATWSYRNIAEAPKGLYGITRTPSGTIYMTGFDGKLLRSDDEGKTWSFRQLWYLAYKDIAMFSDDRGLLVGGVSFNQGCKTYLFGNGNYSDWDSLSYELNDIEMIDGKTGYIGAHGVVLKTEDSGYSWQMLDVKDDNFKAVRAYGTNEAWACGYNGSIFHTSDGGRTWSRMRNGNDITKPRYKLLDIVFTDALHGFAVGEDGLFIYTDDGGYHWMEFERFTGDALRCIISKSDGSLMVCGDNGGLYRVLPGHFR